MQTLHFQVEASGARMDRWLADRIASLSRARIQALIKTGHIRVDGVLVKAHRPLQRGETIAVTLPDPAPASIRPEPIPLDVLYEDADLIVLNKPAGLVVHPAAGHADGTLVNALLYHCHDLTGIGGEQRPGIVHRLDRDTSGVLIVAKQAGAHQHLVAQFKSRRVRKEYLALVWGCPSPPAGKAETQIGRSSSDRKKMSAVPARGRPAITTYETLESFRNTTLLRVRIETGRTHQIRVHMAFLGFPVVGDRVYGRQRPESLPAPAPRQMLHAEHLALIHPRTNTALLFQAPIPADMRTLIAALREETRTLQSEARCATREPGRG